MKYIHRTHTEKRKNPLSELRDFPWSILMIVFVFMSVQGCGKEAVSERPEDTAKLVKLYTVQDVTGMALEREFAGVTRASQEADLAFRVAGQLVEFPVKEGQNVQKGELLARLDPRDYKNAVQQASASLQGARAQLKAMRAGARPEEIRQLEANLNSAQAQLNEVQARYTRQQQLYNEQIISKQQLDAVKTEYDVALSSLEAAREKLKAGKQGSRPEDIEAQQSQIQMLEAQLRDVSSKLSDTELRAPFDGVVARTYVENFEDIASDESILRLQTLAQLEIVISISETDIAQAGRFGRSLQDVFDMFVDGAVAVFPSSPGREFPLDLKAYETDPDATTQTYRVTLIMEQPDDVHISPGMNVTVRGRISPQLAGVKSTVLVPGNAVFADPSGQPSVWIVNPDSQRATLRSVELGLWQHDSIEILDGLKTGEVIAASAVQMLQAGMKVEQMRDLGKL